MNKDVMTIQIDKEIHKKLKAYCKTKNLKINEYVNQLISIHMNFTIQEKSILPKILKDAKGDIDESIICNSLSSEYKSNMPTQLTLLRTTIDGSGYIGNYVLK